MSLCILTNATALFPPTSSTSIGLIRSMPLEIDENGIILPGIEDFSRLYNDLEREFTTILVLTACDSVLPIARTAQLAAQSHGGTANIKILNTMQLGPGVGILAQLAARKAVAGASLSEVEEYIRSVNPHIFTLLYPDRTPVCSDGENNNHKPAHSSDQMSTLPVYILDEGLLIPYKKVRTQRHLLESLQEFVGEFEKPQHLAYFHGKEATLHTRPLRETAGSLFPGTHYNDLDLNIELTALFGDHTVGLTVLEMPEIGWI